MNGLPSLLTPRRPVGLQRGRVGRSLCAVSPLSSVWCLSLPRVSAAWGSALASGSEG